MFNAFISCPAWERSWASALFLAAGCLTFFAPAPAAAAPQIIPCATDAQGRPMSFNVANPGHEYTCDITVTANDDGSEDVLIKQPVVDDPHHFFEYKQITFSPGDIVTFTADGCVQTGGSGDTWKRYLNPNGPNSGPPSGLYFGTVKIEFAQLANGPLIENTPLASLTPPIPVPGLAPQKIFIPSLPNYPNVSSIDLVLGYVDDNSTEAGGNGYWQHDDGNNGQCANTSPDAPYGQFGGPAWVKLHVVHDKSNPFGSVVHKDWDLVAHGMDPNGLPLNPEWGWQINGGLLTSTGIHPLGPDPAAFTVGCPPACTSQNPSFDEAQLSWGNALNHFFGVCQHYDPPQNYNPWTASGHLDWFDATYTGKIFWVTHDGGAFGDDDYNMRIVTPNFHRDPAGTTFFNVNVDDASDEDNIGIEFDSDETIDRYSQSAFWNSFHQAVDNQGDVDAGGLIENHDAVVIGLMGIDEMHDVYAEIHPVHALAIREGSQAPNGSAPLNPADDRWFFFVRNWGDEGECSHLQHYLLSNQITLQLPPPSAQQNVAELNVSLTQVFGASGIVGSPAFNSGPQGTFVTFNLPDSANQPYVFGEVSLNWTGKPLPPPGPGARRDRIDVTLASAPKPPPVVVRKPVREESGPEPEQRLRNMWNSTPPDRQALYRTLLAALYPPQRTLASRSLTVTINPKPPSRPAKFPAHASAPAVEKLKRDAARMQALCAANAGRIPSEPKWCEVFKAPPVSIASTMANGTVALTAYDSAGSGLGAIEYSFDGKTWNVYTGPVTLPAGVSALYHRSTDKLGTVEEIRQSAAAVKF